MTDNTGEEVES